MSNFRLGVDLDGVLADFTTSYNNMLRRVSGKNDAGLKPGEEPTCWFWATEYGFTKDEDAAAWAEIKRDPFFWYKLGRYLDAREAVAVLNQMFAAGHEVYFITNRPGIHPQMQSIMWLVETGMQLPQVCCQSGKHPDKGPLIKGLQLTHFIDDKPENCFDAKEHSPETEVFMLRKPYQSAAHIQRAEALGIHIIPSIRDFFEYLSREEKAHALVV